MLRPALGVSRRAFLTRTTRATSAIAAGTLITHADLEAVADEARLVEDLHMGENESEELEAMIADVIQRQLLPERAQAQDGFKFSGVPVARDVQGDGTGQTP
jgi:hypothetical protein